MKTTIDLADDLLMRARQQARREKATLRDVVEQALRQHLAAPNGHEAFRLKRHAFKGKGRQSGVVDRRWRDLRDLIYRIG